MSAPVTDRPAAAPRRDVGRKVARGIGQTLITAGVVVLLFVVYELWVTDIFAARRQHQATDRLDQAWASSAPAVPGAPAAGSVPGSGSAAGSAAAAAPGSGSPGSGSAGAQPGPAVDVVTVTGANGVVGAPAQRRGGAAVATGQGFAKIYIPTFGSDYVYTIIEGTNANDLEVGPGHYSDSQLPGEPGNFAVAGHRVSRGSPFNQLGQLQACDAMVVETQTDWFVYRVLPMSDQVAGWNAAAHPHCVGVAAPAGAYGGVVGREITEPSDYAQVEPVPGVDSTTVPAAAARLITLTTCHPQFSDAQRMIIHGVLVRSYPKTPGYAPPELKESS